MSQLMAERMCPLAEPIAGVLETYAKKMGGGNTSKYVAEGLKTQGMAEGLMRFAEICDFSGHLAADRMGLGEDISSRDALSFLHLVAAGPLLVLSLLGEGGKKLAANLSETKIKLPNASAAAPAVDWVWEGPIDG